MAIKKKSTFLNMDKIEKKNQLVVKSNHLIEASYKLTLQEQRIILLMASMVRPDDHDFQLYRIDVRDFNKIIGVKNTAIYTEIKEITKKIQERVLVIRDLKEERELQIGWLSSAEYFEKQGYVELEFSPKLKPYLLELKSKFTKYQLKNVAGLKSAYSIRIYELLKQYQLIGERYFELEEFKKTLGIKVGSYKNYGDLNRRVLTRAKKELSQKTDISFELKPKKKGNKVIGVYFFIKATDNPDQDEAGLDDVAISDIDLYLKLQQFFCLSPDQSKDVLKEYEKDPKRIESNLKYVERKIKSIKINNVGAYTWKAIQNNWQDQLSLFSDYEAEKRKEAEAQKKLNIFEEGLTQQYRKIRSQKVEEYKTTLSEENIKEVEKIIKEEVLVQHGEKKIGLKTFERIELENYYAEKAGLPSFLDWKKDQIEKFKAKSIPSPN